MNSSACAARAAARTSSSVASGRPKRMFSAIDVAEQERVLVDDADVTAQVGEAEVAHVLAVHEHACHR